MFKLFSRKITVNLQGTNQGVTINNNSDDDIEIIRGDETGKKVLYSYSSIEEDCLQKTIQKKQSRPVNVILAAACFVVIGGFATYSYLTRDTFENRMYQKFYTRMEDHSLNFFIENTGFSEAKKKYMEGEHKVAWLLLKGIPTTYNVKTETEFYQALNLMGMERFFEATEKFESILNICDRNIKPTANWYLGLCYLKIGDIDRAIISLNNIPENTRDYPKAKRLLKRINKKINKV